MKVTLPLSAFSLALLVSCGDSGARYEPILDGQPDPSYTTDLSECQSLARHQTQFDEDTFAATFLGAGTGAIFGRLDNSDPLDGAIAGALAGGISGAVDASEKRKAIVISCLRGRGHKVVG